VVWLHPKAPPLPVVYVAVNRAIVLGSNTREAGTWAFYLKYLSENTTRLIVCNRGNWKPGLLRSVYQYGFYEPAHFVMERKMMLTIKRLAEQNGCAMSTLPHSTIPRR